MLASQRTTETDLKQQVELLKSEKRSLTKELSDLQTKLNQLEADKTTYNRLQDQWKREKHALIKKIELVNFNFIIFYTNFLL
jgi:FtsZ-binding cell division protein ZapB